MTPPTFNGPVAPRYPISHVARLCRWICYLAAGTALGIGAAAAQASGAVFEPHASIQAAAERAVRKQLKDVVGSPRLEITPIEARLTLPACPRALDAASSVLRPGQARTVVAVSCHSTSANWRLPVFVAVSRVRPILVLTQPVGRGESIADASVRTDALEVAGVADTYISAIGEASGWVARRPLLAGTVLTRDALTRETLVRRGQQVALLAEQSGISVRSTGTAMADAAVGQRIRVQNTGSLKLVEGRVDAQGVIRVDR